MTLVNTPPRPVVPPSPAESGSRSAWVIVLGVTVSVVALFVLGNFVLWMGRTNATEPETFSSDGAARFVEVGPPREDLGDPIRYIEGTARGDQFPIDQAEFLATAWPANGAVDLVGYSGVDEAGIDWLCWAPIIEGVTSAGCQSGEVDDVQLMWSESAEGGFFNRSTLWSASVFLAPPEATEMFVLLDSNRYVGADIHNGASYVEWTGDLGKIKRVMAFDAAGNEIYRKDIG